jgi:putative FmdB family regulatory protein
MPLYEYAAVGKGCAKCRKGFEIVQKLVEPKLKKCPACKAPVERVISAVPVHGKYSTKSDSKLKDLGLTKYVKTSDGSYERTVGTGGPKMVRKPEGD